jgi:phosphoglycerate dehydrogenase-like enzyme
VSNHVKILVITPVAHIPGVIESLMQLGNVVVMDDPSLEDVLNCIRDVDVIFTNPNKSKVFIGKEILDSSPRLKVICTASTGTNHIDVNYCLAKKIKVLSLTEERDVINRISSTAEHAFALTLAGLRDVVPAHLEVLSGSWDYMRHIGRQMNCLTVAVIGFGRLGALYASYAAAFGARVGVFDPYKSVNDSRFEQFESFEELMDISDVVSLHVHVTEETTAMVNHVWFRRMKQDVLIINTSRGEVIDEFELVEFLKKNKQARVATDVLANEIRDRPSSPLLKYAQESKRVLVTPHIGGMTREAQSIAYGHSVQMLRYWLESDQ